MTSQSDEGSVNISTSTGKGGTEKLTNIRPREVLKPVKHTLAFLLGTFKRDPILIPAESGGNR